MSMETPATLRRVLDLEGTDGLLVDLGALSPPIPGQTVTVVLRLTGLLPDRRAAVTLSLFELVGEEERPLAFRTLEVDAQPQAGQVCLPPVRFSLPRRCAPYRYLVVRAESAYLGQCAACALSPHT